MAINLQKGQKVNLEKKTSTGLGEILVNLNWNSRPVKKGFLSGLLSGNQAKDTTAFFPEIQELLGDCSVSERAVLTEIAYAAKRSIRVHGVSRPP